MPVVALPVSDPRLNVTAPPASSNEPPPTAVVVGGDTDVAGVARAVAEETVNKALDADPDNDFEGMFDFPDLTLLFENRLI